MDKPAGENEARQDAWTAEARGAHVPVRRRWLMVAAGALAAGGALAACSSTTTTTTATVAAKATPAPPVTVHEAMTIVTGGMMNHSGWPQFIPADVTVPLGATVDMTIYSYDDGTAPLPASTAVYAKASGVSDLVEGSQTVTSMSPSAVAHTWTVPQLGINVPIGVAPTTSGPRTPLVVTFSFKATKAGTFTWKCFAPCGNGSDGMAGAMATNGYMVGTLTVA